MRPLILTSVTSAIRPLKYYGLKVSVFLLFTMYCSMAAAALGIEMLFKVLGLVPAERHAKIVETAIQWNYTTILNIIFFVLTCALLFRFFRTGGRKMLKMMDRPYEPASTA